MQQKHILAVNDISCMGRCSLTLALPVISAAGIITSVIPTAVLSTHTTGFTGYNYRDLSSDILPIAGHWQTLSGFSFDAIYTGYLGSQEQIDIVAELIRRFKKDKTLILIDPVMADHGRLYAGFSADFPSRMAELCTEANVITPNITEALLMLDKPYKEGPYSREFIQDILYTISKGRKVVLTGVYFSEEEYGAAVYDGKSTHFSLGKRIPGDYNGTGDLFASLLTAALVKGISLNKATDIAVDYTLKSIERTYKAGTDVKYGVNFEEGLSGLLQLIRAAHPHDC